MLGFDRVAYVATPGQPYTVQILLGAPVPVGLFSYGVRVTFNDAYAQVANVAAIHVPLALDFNGVRGPGALRAVGPGFAAVKGTVDFAKQPTEPYSQTLLATLQVNADPFQFAGSYDLALEIFQTLGTNETVFVGGDGSALDPVIGFGRATVTVVPEGSSFGMIGFGLANLMLWSNRAVVCSLFKRVSIMG
jgi:hypothetical protein